MASRRDTTLLDKIPSSFWISVLGLIVLMIGTSILANITHKAVLIQADKAINSPHMMYVFPAAVIALATVWEILEELNQAYRHNR